MKSISFDEWMKEVDRMCVFCWNKTLIDYPAMDCQRAFDDGINPSRFVGLINSTLFIRLNDKVGSPINRVYRVPVLNPYLTNPKDEHRDPTSCPTCNHVGLVGFILSDSISDKSLNSIAECEGCKEVFYLSI